MGRCEGRWGVQVRQYTKGSPEITIFHSFARSNYFVQLKYRFSPPSPRLSRVRLLQCRSHTTLPLPPLPLSSHATLHTVASTVPNPLPPHFPFSPSPILLYSHRFLPYRSFFCLSYCFSSSLSYFLVFSPFFLFLSPFSLFFSLYLHLRHSISNSIIGYVNARGRFAKSGKRSRLRFLRAHKRTSVSLLSRATTV